MTVPRVNARTHGITTISGPEPLQTGFVLHTTDEDVLVMVHRRHLTFLDTLGQVRGRFGREGLGPGEFLGIQTVGLHHDSVWIVDRQAARETMVHIRDLGFRTSVLPFVNGRPKDLDAVWRLPHAITESGSHIASAYIDGRPPADAGTILLSVMRNPDSIGRVLVSDSVGFECFLPNGGRPVVVPACQRPLQLVAPSGGAVLSVRSGVARSDGVTLRLVRVATSGDTLMTVSIALPARRMTRELRDSVIADAARRVPFPVTGRGYSPPEQFGPVLYGVLGDDGTLWLAALWTTAGRKWFVVDPDGTLVGEFSLDPDLTVGAVSRDGAWAVRDLENGDAELVRITIQPMP